MADWWHDMKGKYGDFGKIAMRKHSSAGMAEDIGKITSPSAYPSATDFVRETRGFFQNPVTLYGTIELDPTYRDTLLRAAINDGTPIAQLHGNRARSPDDAQRNAERKRAEKQARKISRRTKK